MCSWRFPRIAARFFGRNAVAVRQVSRIDRKIDAIWQARALVAVAGGFSSRPTHMLAGDRQSAAGATATAGALTRRTLGADVARAKHVQQRTPHHAPSELDAYQKRWFFVDHTFANLCFSRGSLAASDQV